MKAPNLNSPEHAEFLVLIARLHGVEKTLRKKGDLKKILLLGEIVEAVLKGLKLGQSKRGRK